MRSFADLADTYIDHYDFAMSKSKKHKTGARSGQKSTQRSDPASEQRVHELEAEIERLRSATPSAADTGDASRAAAVQREILGAAQSDIVMATVVTPSSTPTSEDRLGAMASSMARMEQMCADQYTLLQDLAGKLRTAEALVTEVKAENAALRLQLEELMRAPPAPAAGGAQATPAAGNGNTVHPGHYKTVFKMSVKYDVRDDGRALAAGVEKTIKQMRGVKVTVVEARRLKPKSRAPGTQKEDRTLIFFRVADVWQAEDVVRNRRHLRGSAITIFDYLSPEELDVYKALKPKFDEARKGGKRAHFLRARLFVEGREVKATA